MPSFGKHVQPGISMPGKKRIKREAEMEEQYGILADLERCVGCYTCEVACEQENSHAPETPWIRVSTIGPKMVNGQLRMDYLPMISDRCIFPAHGLAPPCVANCPTKALKICATATMLDDLGSGKRYQICRLGVPR